MKIKTMMCAALAAVTFAACSNDSDNPVVPAEEADGVYIRFAGLSGETRAESAPVADQTPVTFTDGYLVFGDFGADEITHVVTITNNTASANTVTVNALENGVLFSGIEADYVYVIGNVTAVSPVVGGSVSALLATTVEVDDQTDTTGGLTTATLYGEGQIVDVTPGSNGQVAGAEKEAIFSVKPHAARFEISKIAGDATIASFELAGIYVNNTYVKLGLNGSALNANLTTAGGDLLNYGTDASQYTAATGYSSYLTLFDEFTTPIASTSAAVAPAAGNVWSYNVLAPAGQGNTVNAVPHIVIHFGKMVTEDGNYVNGVTGGQDAYLTISRYFLSSVEQPIEASKIYKIASVAFDKNDLDDVPEEKNQDEDGFTVYVEVEFVDWTAVDLDGVGF